MIKLSEIKKISPFYTLNGPIFTYMDHMSGVHSNSPLTIQKCQFNVQIIDLQLKPIRTHKETDNDENYWMFTYDFKEKKKDSIFDREPEDIIREKNKKNKLIVILYLLSALIFIYAMFFFTKLIYLILN